MCIKSPTQGPLLRPMVRAWAHETGQVHLWGCSTHSDRPQASEPSWSAQPYPILCFMALVSATVARPKQSSLSSSDAPRTAPAEEATPCLNNNCYSRPLLQTRLWLFWVLQTKLPENHAAGVGYAPPCDCTFQELCCRSLIEVPIALLKVVEKHYDILNSSHELSIFFPSNAVWLSARSFNMFLSMLHWD